MYNSNGNNLVPLGACQRWCDSESAVVISDAGVPAQYQTGDGASVALSPYPSSLTPNPLNMKYHSLLLSLFVLLFAVGCSDKMPLSGTVTFSDDGSPVTRGAIFFQSDKVLAQGEITENGSYIVGTDKKTDGLPRGTYKVFITGTEKLTIVQVQGPSGTTGETAVETPSVDKKYGDVSTSGLEFTVDGKTKKFDIKVDRAGAGR